MPRLSPSWQRQTHRGLVLSNSADWGLPALSSLSPCCLSSPAPIHRTQCYLFLADKDWCSSCASFSPTFFFFCSSAGCFAFIPSALPSLLPPPFSSARSHWLCIAPSFSQLAGMSDIAVSGCAYPPPLPHSSSPSFLLSSFRRRRREIFFLPSVTLLLLFGCPACG